MKRKIFLTIFLLAALAVLLAFVTGILVVQAGGGNLARYLLAAVPVMIFQIGIAAWIALRAADKLARGVSSKIDAVSDSLKSLNAGEYMPLKTENVREPEFRTLFQEINTLNESTCRCMKSEKEIARQKSDFFANASHELKTPLTVMRGMAELLAQGGNLDEKQKKQLERIDKESLRLNDLISDMLKISNLERGEEKEERAWVNLKEVAGEVIAELSDELRKKGVTAEISGEGSVFADGKKMFDLVQNLCSNAVNYNRENGWVRVEISETDAGVTLCVQDSGIGIEKEHLPRLCERFYRVDKSRSKKTGGTGLGLAIVKHICVLYNAELSIESEFGTGTCVAVRFKK